MPYPYDFREAIEICGLGADRTRSREESDEQELSV